MNTVKSGWRGFKLPIQPRLMILLLILPVAFFVARSGSHSEVVTQQQAVGIARDQIHYKPDNTSIRYLHQGLPPKGYWAVSLWQESATGERSNVTVVLVDARSGEVTQISRDVDP